MKHRILLQHVLCVFLSVLFFSCQSQDPIEQKVEALLARMTLEEKIGQMNQIDPSWETDIKTEQIRNGLVGSIFNVVGAEEVNYYQRIAVEQTRLGIPLLCGRDVIHGFKTIYPIPLGQAATWNPELIEQAAALTADEALQAGVNCFFSPMVDVARDPRWGRIAEGYGEDTYLASVFSAATVSGYQNDKPVAACVKHFAGYSASEGGRDYNTTWIPEIQLRDVYLPPFKAAIDAGCASVMCSFNDLNGLPSSANRHLNVDILREEWHFDGLLVSDWGSGSDLVPHGLVENKKEAAKRCIDARMEMDMQGYIYLDYLKELIEEKQITEKQIDDCVRSILRLKYRLGLFDNPYIEEDEPDYYTPQALQLATQTVEQSAILLKNNGILPLLPNQPNQPNQPINLLITGPLAHAPKEQLGTWIFDGEPEHSVTPLDAFKQGLSDAAEPKYRLAYEPCLNYSRDTSHADFAKTIKAAKQSDIILYFGGEEAILSGEARCRADISLPGIQAELMDKLAATGKPVVLVVMAGRPLTIGKQIEQASAVLYSFHGGTMAGPALYNLIMGLANPSGKLPVTMPQMIGQIPLYYNRHNTGRPATTPMLINDIPVGCPQFSIGQSSYHLEVGDQPLFPFGYGLSYSTFEYGQVKLNKTSISNDTLVASCTITNTSDVDGYETAQLYVRDLAGELVRPIKELKGFDKVFVPAHESVQVSFALTAADLAYWHEEHKGYNTKTYLSTDPGTFHLWIAPDSRLTTQHVAFSYQP